MQPAIEIGENQTEKPTATTWFRIGLAAAKSEHCEKAPYLFVYFIVAVLLYMCFA